MPLSIRLSSNRHFVVNLNDYRNGNEFMLGDVKKEYSKLVIDQIPTGIKSNKVSVLATYHHGNNNRFDDDNVTTIHRKFFQDALVQAGVIEDDTHEYIEFFYTIGDIDKFNPRIEFLVVHCLNISDTITSLIDKEEQKHQQNGSTLQPIARQKPLKRKRFNPQK